MEGELIQFQGLGMGLGKILGGDKVNWCFLEEYM